VGKARDLVIDITGGKFPVHRLFTPSNQIQQPEKLNGIRLGGKDSNLPIIQCPYVKGCEKIRNLLLENNPLITR
jgi:hypothetical protein